VKDARDLATQLARDGYVILRDLVTEDVIAPIREAVIDPSVPRVAWGNYSCRSDTHLLPVVFPLLHHELVASIIGHLFTNVSPMVIATVITKGRAGSWHVDGPFDDPFPPPTLGSGGSVGVIWALDPFTDENGSTEIMPFHGGPMVRAVMTPGSVLLTVGGHCTHRQGPNTSGDRRAAFLVSNNGACTELLVEHSKAWKPQPPTTETMANPPRQPKPPLAPKTPTNPAERERRRIEAENARKRDAENRRARL